LLLGAAAHFAVRLDIISKKLIYLFFAKLRNIILPVFFLLSQCEIFDYKLITAKNLYGRCLITYMECDFLSFMAQASFVVILCFSALAFKGILWVLCSITSDQTLMKA
jgi:hypothetical protein